MEENNNILSGDISSLKELKNLVAEYTKAKSDYASVSADERRLEKELNNNKKDLKDNIEGTVKSRRLQIAAKFDSEINKEQERLKKVKNKREKAKNKGVKERIADETSELVSQNDELKRNIKSTLKTGHIPKFCGSSFFFTIYFTKGVSEVFKCALAILVMFLILPAAVYVALPIEKMGAKWEIPMFAITYFVVIIIVFAVYKLVGDRTKHKHLDELKGIRTLRDQIKNNNRQIAKIARSVKKDKNEDMYGLDDYDNQMKSIDQEISRIDSEKNAALVKFDETASKDIIAEIENREMPRINQIEENYGKAVAEKTRLEELIKQMGLKISTDYEAYMGKEFMDLVRIDSLISIMETGSALTVSEAITAYKSIE